MRNSISKNTCKTSLSYTTTTKYRITEHHNMDKDNSSYMLPAPGPTYQDLEKDVPRPQGVTINDNSWGVDSVRQRANLRESERLQLVRLCCTRREEYLQGKERFWDRRTQEFNATSSKNIANARSIVMRMLSHIQCVCLRLV